jgi:hypothetical protein
MRAGEKVGALPLASLFALFALATLAACDLGEPARPRFDSTATPVVVVPPRDFVSGTRLHARYYVVDGVVEVLAGFHDVVLDADCAFEDSAGAHVGPGGASYCVPDGVARHQEDRGPYVDAACTLPAAATPSTGAATYALVEPNDACSTAPQVHLALPPSSRRTYARSGSGGCSAAGAASVQALGALAPPDTFVRAMEMTELRAGRIAARVLVSDDGFRHAIGGFDVVRGEASRVGTTTDGMHRWLPARPAFVGAGAPLFVDAMCSEPVATKIGRTATCPLSAVIVLEGLCGTGQFFALGAPLASVFQPDAKNACVGGPAGNVLVFRVGAPIADAAYEPAVSVDVGTSRVRRRGSAAGSDTPVVWTDLVDDDTKEPCDVYPTADGSLRCLPAASAGVAFFADPGCTEPAFAQPTGCETGPDPHFVHDSFDAAARAFEVVRPIDTLYETGASGCVRFTPVVESRLYAVKELDTATFPLATALSE